MLVIIFKFSGKNMPTKKTKQTNPEVKASRGRPKGSIKGFNKVEEKIKERENKPKRGRPKGSVVNFDVVNKRKSKKKTNPKKSSTTTQVKATKTKQWFSTHKLTNEKSNYNFAFWLMIFSFFLFIFSLYKAFLEPNQPILPQPEIQANTAAVAAISQATNMIDNTNIQESIEPDVIIMEWENVVENTGTVIDEPSETQEPNIETWFVEPTSTIEESVEVVSETKKYEVEPYVFEKAFTLGAQDPEIEILQKHLANLWYFTGTVNGIYDESTVDAVLLMQEAMGLIKPTTPKMAKGYLGPSTRANLNELIAE